MAFFQFLSRKLRYDDPRQLRRELGWLAGRCREHRSRIFLTALLGLTAAALGLFSGLASKYLVDAVTARDRDALSFWLKLMAAGVLGNVTLQAISGRVSAAIHIRVRTGLQHRSYGHILRAGWEALEPYRSGDLLSRLTSDVSAVSDGIIHFLPALLCALLKLLGALALIARFDPVMAALSLLSIPLTLLLSRTAAGKLRSHDLHLKELGGRLMSFQEDSFRNLTSIKAFALTDRFEDDLHRQQADYADAYLSHNAFHIRTGAFLSLAGIAVSGICLAWGTARLWSGAITYGSLMLFLQLAGTIRGAFSTLLNLARQLIAMMTSAGRLIALESLPGEDLRIPQGLDREDALDILLEGVSFHYRDGAAVLEDFHFTARHGDLIAVTGPSGEGKTTLLRLLLGLVEPDTGTARLLGGSGTYYPITPGTRPAFAYVPQGSSIFSGTVRENLLLARPDATDAQLERALRAACAWDFVQALPKKLEHPLGAGGRGLSEGQCQRLAIARALLRHAPVLLLDEATSGLDIATERQLLDSLRQSGLVKTCILVTHRPESARFCTRTYEIQHSRREEA